MARDLGRSGQASALEVGPLKCTGWPSRRISPLSIVTAPQSALISVDLPAPLSPITASTSPG